MYQKRFQKAFPFRNLLHSWFYLNAQTCMYDSTAWYHVQDQIRHSVNENCVSVIHCVCANLVQNEASCNYSQSVAPRNRGVNSEPYLSMDTFGAHLKAKRWAAVAATSGGFKRKQHVYKLVSFSCRLHDKDNNAGLFESVILHHTNGNIWFW